MSPEYHALCKRLVDLCCHLLPPLNPTGAYSREEEDKTRALCALAHAEIEHFIETRCLHVARSSVQNWMENRQPNPVVFALFAVSYSGWSALGDGHSLKKVSEQIDVEARIGSSLCQYEQVVGLNHGIKEANLKTILVPLSVRMKADLDESWLTAMSNFGADRGKIVHSSWKVNQPPDPADLRKLLGKILLPGLRTLDKCLSTVQVSMNQPVGTKKDPGFFEKIAALIKKWRYGQQSQHLIIF